LAAHQLVFVLDPRFQILVPGASFGTFHIANTEPAPIKDTAVVQKIFFSSPQWPFLPNVVYFLLYKIEKDLVKCTYFW